MKIIPEGLFGSYMNIDKCRMFIRNKGSYYEVEEISPNPQGETIKTESIARAIDIFDIKVKDPAPAIYFGIDEGFIPIYPGEADYIDQPVLDELKNNNIIHVSLYLILNGIANGIRNEYVNTLLKESIFIDLSDLYTKPLKIKEEFMFKRALATDKKKTYESFIELKEGEIIKPKTEKHFDNTVGLGCTPNYNMYGAMAVRPSDGLTNNFKWYGNDTTVDLDEIREKLKSDVSNSISLGELKKIPILSDKDTPDQCDGIVYKDRIFTIEGGWGRTVPTEEGGALLPRKPQPNLSKQGVIDHFNNIINKDK